MYTLAVRRSILANHFLVGGNWGEENRLHPHQYQVEIELGGETLDQYGYLVDIVDLGAVLDEIVQYFQGSTLNELPEFAGANPSIENFARVVFRSICRRINAPNISSIHVRIWEDDIARAGYQELLR